MLTHRLVLICNIVWNNMLGMNLDAMLMLLQGAYWKRLWGPSSLVSGTCMVCLHDATLSARYICVSHVQQSGAHACNAGVTMTPTAEGLLFMTNLALMGA